MTRGIRLYSVVLLLVLIAADASQTLRGRNLESEEPCMIMECGPGFKVVRTDSRGCGGMCKKKKNTGKKNKPCLEMACAPGFNLVNADARGCGGECEEEPCLMMACAPGFDLINTDSRGCGGECEKEPCVMVDCAPGFDLINANLRGCGGECVSQDNGCLDAAPTCPPGVFKDSCLCTTEYTPVCGCDGVLYGNLCMATCAGVVEEPCVMVNCAPGFNLINTDSRGCGGECEEEPCMIMDCAPNFNLINADSRGCGGECVSQDNGCLDAAPTCSSGNSKKACVCTKEYRPVCGCDGVLYSNLCMATCAGVEAASSD